MQNGTIRVKKSPVKARHKTGSTEKSFGERPLLLTAIILTVTFIAFFPSLKNDFCSTWDDNLFVTNNPMIRHLDLHSLTTMFTTPVADAYVPLPVLTFAVEYHLFGLNPLPYHFTNLILHLICTLLIFQFLRLLKLDSIYAAFGALLFGIHPMHVESVVWITERKDLLYGLFYLASIICYLKYIRLQGKGLNFFILGLFFFILALFSKIQAVTLPIVLFLIDYYTERPLKLKLILEKIPYVVLSLVFGISGIIILKRHGNLQGNEISPLFERIVYGIYAFSAYIVKFFAPFHLSAIYPLPQNTKHALPLIYSLSLITPLLLGFILFRTVRLTRAIVFGTLFFLFNIIFMLQVLTVGSTFLSDRYSYVSYVGFCFMAGWSLDMVAKNKKELKHICIAAMSIVIILFSSLTFNRCKIWKNSETLWTDVIEKYPDKSAIPYNNRGFYYYNLGQWTRAVDDFTRAIGISPDDNAPYSNRGVAYANMGQWDKAIADCSRAIEINPNDANAYSTRGNAYEGLEKWDKTIADCSRAIEIKPDLGVAYTDRGVAYANLGKWDKAIADCSRAIEIEPNDEKAFSNRGNAEGSLGLWDRAIADYSRAIAIKPDFGIAYINRGVANGSLGQWDKAISDYTSAIEIDPNLRIAYTNREIAIRNLKSGKK